MGFAATLLKVAPLAGLALASPLALQPSIVSESLPPTGGPPTSLPTGFPGGPLGFPEYCTDGTYDSDPLFASMSLNHCYATRICISELSGYATHVPVISITKVATVVISETAYTTDVATSTSVNDIYGTDYETITSTVIPDAATETSVEGTTELSTSVSSTETTYEVTATETLEETAVATTTSVYVTTETSYTTTATVYVTVSTSVAYETATVVTVVPEVDTITQTTGTVVTTTSLCTTVATSTVTNLSTSYTVVYTTVITSVYTTTLTQTSTSLLKKRAVTSLINTETAPTSAPTSSATVERIDRWISSYGLESVDKACKCLVHPPPPTGPPSVVEEYVSQTSYVTVWSTVYSVAATESDVYHVVTETDYTSTIGAQPTTVTVSISTTTVVVPVVATVTVPVVATAVVTTTTYATATSTSVTVDNETATTSVDTIAVTTTSDVVTVSSTSVTETIVVVTSTSYTQTEGKTTSVVFTTTVVPTVEVISSTISTGATSTKTVATVLACSSNPVVNGGFVKQRPGHADVLELSPWTFRSDSNKYSSGITSWVTTNLWTIGESVVSTNKLGGTGTTADKYFGIKQTITTCPGLQYTCTYWFRWSDTITGATPTPNTYGMDGAIQGTAHTATTCDWAQYSFTVIGNASGSNNISITAVNESTSSSKKAYAEFGPVSCKPTVQVTNQG
ncbi:hypothetical protein BX600DRAFT_443538 [Xylariales sp. PMI_506]|nr:hypothetical protein BX600DRAFT_443538 [Xylariales sp. PMI_506]